MKRKTILFAALISLTILVYRCSTDEEGFYLNPDDMEYSYNEKYTDYGENPFIKVSEEPVSTFGVDADGASYANMRRYINLGQNPPKSSVRVEEYINYFTFDYPEPIDENVSLSSEITTCPWNTEHHLIRVGLKGKTIQPEQRPASNLVFLIDVSGSMNSPDKIGILKTGFKLMVDGLTNIDKVAIVIYAGESGVLLQSTNGAEKEKIKAAIDKLGASGSTAGSAGISTAYEIATQNFVTNGNNRIILGTDGDFNVGPSTTKELIEMIEQKRKTGIFLTVLGVGGDNLNDAMMEQLANKGNGNYEYIDNIEQLKKVFVYEFSKFYTIAKDSKIQLTFNENCVESYRLIGYENRVLNQEDFANDTIDAGEIGSGQTITAIYEIILTNNQTLNDFATLDFRYKIPTETTSRPISIKLEGPITDFLESSENTRFCASVAGYAMILKESQYKGNLTTEMIIDWASNAKTFDPNSFRSEFVTLVRNTTK